MDLKYDFHLGAGDNGNAYGITNNRSTGRSQSFTYDALNRISTGQSSATSGSACWGQSFGIDPWGNMTSETTTKCSAGLLSTTASVKNQLVGYGYDAAGNLTQEGSGSPSWTYTYDAENRISSITGSASETFKYDGDGERVYKSYGAIFWGLSSGAFLSKATLSGTINSERIYFGGRHVAIVNGTTPSYLFPDHLGGEHVVTNASGTICNDVDTLPFGGEIDYTASCGPSYIFAGMDRGNENSSDLDYAVNRYYDLRMARFMTPDWAGNPTDVPYANFGDPQSLNLYSYVKNNPTTLTDPNGHCDVDGEHHWGWCLWHTFGFYDTAKDIHDEAEAIRHSYANPDPYNIMTDKQVIDADQQRIMQMVIGVSGGADIEEGEEALSILRKLKPVNLPAWRTITIDMEEVLSGHTATGSRAIQSGIKDLFPSGMSAQQIEGAIREAYRYGEKVATQGDRVLVRGQSGGLTIEMWVNRATRTIETAYPAH